MKWETDWLHNLILRDIESIWKRAVKDGVGEFGPSPDYLVVSQYADLLVCPDTEDKPPKLVASFVSPVISHWVFDDSGIRPKEKTGSEHREKVVERGMFYQVGNVSFAISSDRNLVAINFGVGPRYAQRRVLGVSGQGKTGMLSPHPDFSWWIS